MFGSKAKAEKEANQVILGVSNYIVENVVKHVRLIKAEYPQASNQAVYGKVLRKLCTNDDQTVWDELEKNVCLSINGLCYVIVFDFHPAMKGLMNFRYMQAAKMIDSLLADRGYTEQSLATRQRVLHRLLPDVDESRLNN